MTSAVISRTDPEARTGESATRTASTQTPPTETVPAETATGLRMAVLILSRRMRSEQTAGELSPSEAAVLGRIGRDGPQTPGALARAEHVQPPSMTRIIERLETRGLLRRDPHPDDRRQLLISRTPAGDDLVARTKRARTAWLTRQLDRLPAEQHRLIDAAVPALLALADLAEPAPDELATHGAGSIHESAEPSSD